MPEIVSEQNTEFPKTKEGLLELIGKTLSENETTYVCFCAELEAFEADPVQIVGESGNEMNWFCNNNCEIHRLHNAQMLLCLPLTSKNLLRDE